MKNQEIPVRNFFGHPRGLATLFFTEMWERFSYYGMRALLYLYMVATVEKGGLGFDEETSGAIYGLYTMLVYLLALPGGWLADHFWGLRKSVFYGGCIIAIGHLCLALPYIETFFIGLLFIVTGTGLLKPNISSMVGELYPAQEQAKRDAGFSIFYMGINIGAFISPFITAYLGEQINWHYGFAAAGIGMIAGLVQYKLTESSLGVAGLRPVYLPGDEASQQKKKKQIRVTLWIVGFIMILFLIAMLGRMIVPNPILIAKASAYILACSVLLYFVYLLLFEELDTTERNKIIAMAIFFIMSAVFYAGYEQQGSSLNLFAKRYTNMFIGAFEMPAGWLQSVSPVAVIIFSPIVAWLWVNLSRKKINPSIPVKISFGLIFMGLGYLVMMQASRIVAGGDKVLPFWLIATYVLHTFGEICLYPVGLSATTKLSPKRLVGQMMGIWFMSLAFGNLIAGLFTGHFDEKVIAKNPERLSDLFWQVAAVMLLAGIVSLIISKPVKKLMGNVR